MCSSCAGPYLKGPGLLSSNPRKVDVDSNAAPRTLRAPSPTHTITPYSTIKLLENRTVENDARASESLTPSCAHLPGVVDGRARRRHERFVGGRLLIDAVGTANREFTSGSAQIVSTASCSNFTPRLMRWDTPKTAIDQHYISGRLRTCQNRKGPRMPSPESPSDFLQRLSLQRPDTLIVTVSDPLFTIASSVSGATSPRMKRSFDARKGTRKTQRFPQGSYTANVPGFGAP